MVVDADGNLVQGVAGNPSGVIDERYVYDWFGNITQSQDGNGYTTLYEYDLLNRIIHLTYPDQSGKSWSYNDTENILIVTDANNEQMEYIYDGFGNLLFEKDVTSGQYLRECSYDQYFRLNSEQNVLSENGQKTSYIYYPDGRIQIKKVTDKDNEIISMEEYQYSDAFDIDNNGSADCVKITKTIYGDENSPSIVSTSYFDKTGRIIRDGRMFDGQEQYNTYFYDYLGNKTQEKHDRANKENWTESFTARYEYDHAGRLTKTEDILGYFSTIEYDALGRIISKKDNKGNMHPMSYATLYRYDNLDRLIEEQTPFEINGSQEIQCTIKKYYYDNNSNIITEKQTNNKADEDIHYSRTDYEYDSRSRLVTVVTYDD